MSTALLNFIPVKLVNPDHSWNFVFSYLDIFSNEENSKFKVEKCLESWDFELCDVRWRHKLNQLIRIVSTSGQYQFSKVLGDLSHWWSSYRSFSEIQKCSCDEVFVELTNSQIIFRGHYIIDQRVHSRTPRNDPYDIRLVIEYVKGVFFGLNGVIFKITAFSIEFIPML